MRLETQRLWIRLFQREDQEEFNELIRDKMASPDCIWDAPFPTDDLGLRDVLAFFSGKDEFYAVTLKETKRLIGFLTLNRCEEQSVRNLGFCLHTEFRGKGYAREACEALIVHARDTMRLKKLVSGTAEENLPSVRLLDRLGFRILSRDIARLPQKGGGPPLEVAGYSLELSLERLCESCVNG